MLTNPKAPNRLHHCPSDFSNMFNKNNLKIIIHTKIDHIQSHTNHHTIQEYLTEFTNLILTPPIGSGTRT